MNLRRRDFLQLAASIVTLPLGLHVSENGARYTLKSTLYRPNGTGPFPLVVLNHGAPANYADVPSQFETFTDQSAWFVARGCAVLVPNRRGYGGSTGPFAESVGPCAHPNFLRAANASADDVVAAIGAVVSQRTVDSSRIVVAGQSAGGYASLAVGARAQRGLVGIVNIDGGRGSLDSGQNCDPAQLVAVAGDFGVTARAPSLWLYARNDERFTPSLARKMFDAYERHRPAGVDRFVVLPPYDTDGHTMFSYAAAIPLWAPYVAPFLKRVLG